MKNAIRAFSPLILCLCLINCTPENDYVPKEYDVDTLITQTQTKNLQNNLTYPVRSIKELIVGFNKDMNDHYKKNLRKKYGVINFERCDCTNTRIEKWEFANDIDIEERKGEIVQEGGVEGTDYQYFYSNENNSPGLAASMQDANLIVSYVKSMNQGPTIAILDTGLDLNKIASTQPFLHKEDSPMTPCPGSGQEIAGWDFVNNDNNVYDDNGHGTIVTDIVKSYLDTSSISAYQMLPVKVFDAAGKGNTFDILCGYLYAAEKPRVKIINMSFGWYLYPSELLSLYMKQNPDIVHIASAGNSGVNTDQIPHFPSSIPFKHMISVGSFEKNVYKGNEIVSKSSFSNFGIKSVDFLSVGEDVMYYDPIGDFQYLVEGTSFSAPLVTAKAASHFVNGFYNPVHIKNQLANNANMLSANQTLPVKYADRIIE